MRLKCNTTSAETRFRLSAKRTSPFKSARASVQSITGSRVVHISGSNAGYTMFRGSVQSSGYLLHSPVSPSIRFRASRCAITFQLESTSTEQLALSRLVVCSHRVVKQGNKSERLPMLQEIRTPLLHQKTGTEVGFQLIRSGTHCCRQIFSHNVKHGRLSS
jgi:hypothetical protein